MAGNAILSNFNSVAFFKLFNTESRSSSLSCDFPPCQTGPTRFHFSISKFDFVITCMNHTTTYQISRSSNCNLSCRHFSILFNPLVRFSLNSGASSPAYRSGDSSAVSQVFVRCIDNGVDVFITQITLKLVCFK